MAHRRRSDPKKLLKEREEIRRSMASREQAPADQTYARPKALDTKKPSLLNQIEAVIKNKISQNKRKGAGFGSPPRVEGALHTGFRKPRGDA